MDSTHPICRACGVQYEQDHDLGHCPICEDERQYIPPDGQRWTTLAELRDEGHRTVHRDELYGLPAIGTDPRFAHRATRPAGARRGRKRVVGLHHLS